MSWTPTEKTIIVLLYIYITQQLRDMYIDLGITKVFETTQFVFKIHFIGGPKYNRITQTKTVNRDSRRYSDVQKSGTCTLKLKNLSILYTLSNSEYYLLGLVGMPNNDASC